MHFIACLFSCFGTQMSKYWNVDPGLQIFRFVKNLSTFQNCLIYTLPRSPRPLSNHVSNWNYAYFCVLGPRCQNMEIWNQLSNFFDLFWKLSNFKNRLIDTHARTPYLSSFENWHAGQQEKWWWWIFRLMENEWENPDKSKYLVTKYQVTKYQVPS